MQIQIKKPFEARMTDNNTKSTDNTKPLAGADVDTEGLAREIAELTWDCNTINTVAIDLRGRVSYTDFIVVCTATSDRQVQAIARYVERSLRDLGWRTLSTEGIDSGRWALLDYGDAILHIFNQGARQEFDIEGMWAEAPKLELEDAPESLYGHFAMDQFDH